MVCFQLCSYVATNEKCAELDLCRYWVANEQMTERIWICSGVCTCPVRSVKLSQVSAHPALQVVCSAAHHSHCKLPACSGFLIHGLLLTNESFLAPFQSLVLLLFSPSSAPLITPCFPVAIRSGTAVQCWRNYQSRARREVRGISKFSER